MASIVRMDLKEVVQHFKQLEDPRSAVNRLHPLESVIVIAIMAVLAGANGPTAIAKWAKMKCELLLKLLDLPHGIPKKDVFRRVLATLKPDAFQACFTMWLTALRAAAAEATGVERPTLAIDGKTLRRSHDRRRNLGALHSVTCLGERVRPDTRAGGNGREIERNHGDSHTVVAHRYPGSHHHHRRDGDTNGHRGEDH